MAINQEETLLVKRITDLYQSISNLPSLHPSKEVNHLFTQLVLACIPPSTIDVTGLSEPEQSMRARLVRLCADAESLLESHYSSLLTSFDRPLDHLHLFPYYPNYLKLAHLEFNLLSRHLTDPPTRIAFVGSGPLPLSSIVLATRYFPGAVFHNYDLDPEATEKAGRLMAGAGPGLAGRMGFRTADLMGVTGALAGYGVVFLAALVGMGREEKRAAVEHLAANMGAGAVVVVRSANGARGFLYPVVEEEDLKGFEVLSVYHPGDEVINSVIVGRKVKNWEGGSGVKMGGNCKCCEVKGLNQLGHGGIMDEGAIEGQPSS